ncbi:hypothetical protein PQX77_018648 [Marasmius sp. AFHP31]|nr:hypothetical protein PQX77_018648 [Marasmius sp. AFHP31]
MQNKKTKDASQSETKDKPDGVQNSNKNVDAMESEDELEQDELEEDELEEDAVDVQQGTNALTMEVDETASARQNSNVAWSLRGQNQRKRMTSYDGREHLGLTPSVSPAKRSKPHQQVRFVLNTKQASNRITDEDSREDSACVPTRPVKRTERQRSMYGDRLRAAKPNNDMDPVDDVSGGSKRQREAIEKGKPAQCEQKKRNASYDPAKSRSAGLSSASEATKTVGATAGTTIAPLTSLVTTTTRGPLTSYASASTSDTRVATSTHPQNALSAPPKYTTTPVLPHLQLSAPVQALHHPSPLPITRTIPPGLSLSTLKRTLEDICSDFRYQRIDVPSAMAKFDEVAEKIRKRAVLYVTMTSGVDNSSESKDAKGKGKAYTDDGEERSKVRPFPLIVDDVSKNRSASGSLRSPVKRPSDGVIDNLSSRKKLKMDEALTLPCTNPADSNLDYEFDSFFNTGVDHEKLCPFCDSQLPQEPTPYLQKSIDNAVKKSKPQPRPTNRLGRKLAMGDYMHICQRHHFEAELLPQAEAKGWPKNIDFSRLEARVYKLKSHLKDILNDVEWKDHLGEDSDTWELGAKSPRALCVFWQETLKEVGSKGSKVAANVISQFLTFDKTQPG